MSAFTRRSFIGKTAAAAGSFAALQKVVGADRSRSVLARHSGNHGSISRTEAVANATRRGLIQL
jgi:hypothetical protein